MSKLNQEKLLKRLDEKIKHGKEFLIFTPNVKEWQRELQFYQQIKKLIQASTNLKNKSLGRLAQDLGVSFSAAKIISDHAQPEVTEEWIEEKAIKMSNIVISFNTLGSGTNWMANPLERCIDFIHSLIEEIHGRKKD